MPAKKRRLLKKGLKTYLTIEEADIAPNSPSSARKARGNNKSPEIL
jgi:hypothetical protein